VWASRAIPRYETLDSYEWTEDVYYMFKNRNIANGVPSALAGPQALQEMATGAVKNLWFHSAVQSFLKKCK